MNGALIRFGAAAVEMELYAVTALLQRLPTDERKDTIALLRHAKGIIKIVEKRRKQARIAPED